MAAAIPIPENETMVVIPLSSFAVAVQEVQPEVYDGQTFSVLLGTDFGFAEDTAINASSLAFAKREGSTASITIPQNIFSFIEADTSLTNMTTQARITQSVFLTNSLFIRREESELEVSSVIIAAAISGVTVRGIDPPILLTFLKRPVSLVTHSA